MRNILFLCLTTMMLFSCQSANDNVSSATNNFELVLSDELQNLGIEVVDKSLSEDENSVNFILITNKNINSLLSSRVLTFRVLSKDNYEIAGGFLNEVLTDVGTSGDEEDLPMGELNKRGIIYYTNIGVLNISLINKIKLQAY